MRQHHALNTHVVRTLVPRDAIGFYRLGDASGGRFRARYFGRSDVGLRRRLLQHVAAERFPRFQFCATSTIYEAFRQECREWHAEHPQAVNAIHPDAPRWVAYVCPWCVMAEQAETHHLARRFAQDLLYPRASPHQRLRRRGPLSAAVSISNEVNQ